MAYPYEGIHVRCLVLSCQTTFIAFSISSNVLLVPLFQLGDCFFDDFVATIVSHGLGTATLYTYHLLVSHKNVTLCHVNHKLPWLPVIRVSTSTIPITLFCKSITKINNHRPKRITYMFNVNLLKSNFYRMFWL